MLGCCRLGAKPPPIPPGLDRDHPAQVPARGLTLPVQKQPQQPGSVGQGLLPSSGHGRQSHGDWRPPPNPYLASREGGQGVKPSDFGVTPQDGQDCSIPVPQDSRCGWVTEGRIWGFLVKGARFQ